MSYLNGIADSILKVIAPLLNPQAGGISQSGEGEQGQTILNTSASRSGINADNEWDNLLNGSMSSNSASVGATDSTEDTDSTSDTESTESSDSTEGDDSTESTEATESTEVTDTTLQTASTETSESTDSTDTMDSTQSTEATDTTSYSDGSSPISEAVDRALNSIK